MMDLDREIYREPDLYEIAKKYRVISLDLFDTLVFRTVYNYVDIFDLVSIVYENKTGNKCKRFKKDRIRAENTARKKHCREITIDEIYQEIRMRGYNYGLLKEIEEETEIENCIPNNMMVDFANRMFDLGKTVIIVTDMYLSRHTIERILQKIGLRYNSIFISGEEKATKLSGELYKIVIEKMGCHPKEVIHIGDNPITDIQQANRNSIHAEMRIVNDFLTTQERKDGRSKKQSVVCAHYERMYFYYEPRNDNTLSRIGYYYLGPFLYDFCIWLNSIRNNISSDEIVFVSREGALLYKTYCLLFPQEKDHIHYMSVNKNVLRRPLMNSLSSIELFDNSLPSRNEFSINEILQLLDKEAGVKEKAFVMSESGVTSNWIYRRNEQSESKKKFFSALCECFHDSIIDQESCLIDYLKENRLIGKKVLLVNNSINGNGQFLLQEFSNSHGLNNEFVGIQFSISKAAINKGIPIYSYLDECGSIGDSVALARYALIFEHLLFESTGTAIELVRKNGKIEVITEKRRNEIYNDKIIETIQKCTIAFIRENIKNVRLDSYKTTIKMLLSLFAFPTKDEAETVGFLFDDDSNRDRRIIEIGNTDKLDIYRLKSFSGAIWKQGILAVLETPNMIVSTFNRIENIRNVQLALKTKAGYKKTTIFRK